MGKPDNQTDHSASQRAKNEPAQPIGKAPRGKTDLEEPSELSDAIMSNENKKQVDHEAKDNPHEEESSGFLSLEAKAGLSLICILICGFSFMVWQQWKSQQSEITAEIEDDSSKPNEDEEIVLQPNDSSPSETPVSKQQETSNPKLDPFGDQSEPPVTTEVVENDSPPEKKPAAFPDDDPFAEVTSKSLPKKANIPTLEVPTEPEDQPDEELADANAPEVPADDPNQSDPFDPFGKDVVAKDSTAMLSPQEPEASSPPEDDAFDPFGPETNGPDTKVSENKSKPDELSLPAELPNIDNDSFSDKDSPQVADQPDQTPDPFATVEDPFGDSPAEKTAETPDKLMTQETPSSNDASDPFGEPAEKQVPIIPDTSGTKIAANSDSFQDPLPILEPVPSRDTPSKESNPFGEFESVSAGAAQASSVTNVAPEFPAAKMKGTLADLNANPKRSAPSLDDPFSEPKVEQKSEPFHLQQDGTYKVQSGDSYWSISRQAYGSPLYYRALAEFNQKAIPNPENMTAGTAIKIPPTNELERRYPHLVSTSKDTTNSATIVKASAEQDQMFFNDESGNPVYRVQKNDTLTGIAQKYLGRASRWIQIYELNRNNLPNPNNLKIGTLLKLPHDASRVKIVRE